MIEFPLTLALGDLEAEISPRGAELTRLRHRGRDLLWHGDPSAWASRSPILFPVVGRVRDDRVLVGGRAYTMPQHGIVRRRMFAVVEASARSCRLRLVADEETRASYPFAFALELAYRLEGDALVISARVENTGPEPLPASFGFHPGFRWPLDQARPKRDHALWIEAPAPLRVARLATDGLLGPDGPPLALIEGRLDLDEELFEDGALVMRGAQAARIAFGPRDGGGPRVSVSPQNLPDLAIWMRPGADFLCIEPWRGHADPVDFRGELVEKPGSFRLSPCEAMRFGVAIAIEDGAVAT